jgi:hypothetical protein
MEETQFTDIYKEELKVLMESHAMSTPFFFFFFFIFLPVLHQNETTAG